MKIMQLSPEHFVTGQISEVDLKPLSSHGIRSIINNRPDDEDAGQPKSEELALKARELGMEFVHLPVVSGSITQQDVDDFRSACDKLERPILLFCRSGARSSMLWQLSGLGPPIA